MKTVKQSEPTADLGVSKRALSIARMIDRLGSGKFNITLIKPEGENTRWDIEIAQPVTIQKRELHQQCADEQTTQ